MLKNMETLIWVAVTIVLGSLTSSAEDAGAPNALAAQVSGTVSFNLPQELAAEDPAALAAAARQAGDATRGAIVFHQQHMTCTKCHTAGEGQRSLGPDLAKMDKDVSGTYIVESILNPSKEIKKGFESVTAITLGGKTITGLLVSDSAEQLVLRDATEDSKLIELAKSDIDEVEPNSVSIMPEGLVMQMTSRQQFLDLACYLIEIAEGGPTRSLELKPDPSLYMARPLPEYEKKIDHAGMIADLDSSAFKRGSAIYNRLCINCHGTHEQPGSLPTALRFAEGKFKNGNDPYAMYQTLTHGFGMMVPQAWMVPQQKYDAIHYIREAYLKEHNVSQYAMTDKAYLDRLPKGDTRGPEPVEYKPWEEMNYGPNLIATYEIPSATGGQPRDGNKRASAITNFTYKGIAVRVDPGPGGVARGRHWMVFDHDTLRMAAAWSGDGFIDWNGINFNGRHGIHPKIGGQLHFANEVGPGWANPQTGSFEDPRLRGRDDRPYGPLPRDWAHYKGLYHHGQSVVVSYTVGDTAVLEMDGMVISSAKPVFTRTFNIGPRRKDMLMRVAAAPAAASALAVSESGSGGLGIAMYGAGRISADAARKATTWPGFNGATYIDVERPTDFDMTRRDYTISARVRTKNGGSILAKTTAGPEWVPDGKTLFVRRGRLVFDIGWVGDVEGRTKVADGKWHEVAMTWDQETGRVRLYVDGKLDGDGRLKPRGKLTRDVVRIGYTAPDFPRPRSYFDGQMSDVRFYQRALGSAEIAQLAEGERNDKVRVANWSLPAADGKVVRDESGGGHTGRIKSRGRAAVAAAGAVIAAGIAGHNRGLQWDADEGYLLLKIPAGSEPLKFTVWLTSAEDRAAVDPLVSTTSIDRPDMDLAQLTKGGPPRWPTVLTTTTSAINTGDGPFAVDVLTHPTKNPWFCQVRLTGFDFFPDGDRMAVCSWDGDVWLVSGLASLDALVGDADDDSPVEPATLNWQRIASGLFQPLGLKIVDGKIHVTCRDQLVILHDLNGDGETDFYENFNNDHQVTEHFHEFAMGLQTNAQGNFYYAKSARHALKAVVPHHGTLLRVSKDGTRTDILAKGFRAANGVCINPDGTFIVTDQEGHWNPKNRINYVKEGGFYGNMFGYHDVTDASDDAMEQPLCWITNAFDRSPAELLWVDSKQWGPLYGSLLNFSYGYGQIYVVPHEEIDGQAQGGMCKLPIPRLPTGVMRGRFHPQDGQLYTCGMFAWAGNQTQPGGFYRVRYTGKPVHLPIDLKARHDGMEITFSGELDRQVAADAGRYAIKVWSLKRTPSYGSKHYNEQPLKVTSASVSDDGRTVKLTIPDIAPTWCMEIKYALQGAGGEKVSGAIHNTIHRLGP